MNKPTLAELYRAANPDDGACPACGCPGFVLQEREFAGRLYRRRTCPRCALAGEWSVVSGQGSGPNGANGNGTPSPTQSPIPNPQSPIPNPACPACGGARYHVTSTQGKTQYRRCADCRHRGKTRKK